MLHATWLNQLRNVSTRKFVFIVIFLNFILSLPEWLEYRKAEFDLMFMYKIIHGYVDLNFSDFFSVCHSDYNLHRQRRPCTEHLSNFFMHRASQIRNKWPKSIVFAPTFAAFKSHWKKFDCCSVSSLLYYWFSAVLLLVILPCCLCPHCCCCFYCCLV